MTTSFCPSCGAEYLADVSECADCYVPLVPRGGGSEPVEPGDDVVFELGDWSPDQLAQLKAALARDGIDHAWEDGHELVVREHDSDRVDDLLDELEPLDDEVAPADDDAAPADDDDADDDEADDDEADDDDALPYDAVSDLFVAADRLVHSPDDAALAGAFVKAAEALDDAGAPFGVGAEEWERIASLARSLRADLAGGADDDVVAETARTLQALLRGYV